MTNSDKKELRDKYLKLDAQAKAIARKIDELNYQALFDFVEIGSERLRLTHQHRHVARAAAQALAECYRYRVAVFR